MADTPGSMTAEDLATRKATRHSEMVDAMDWDAVQLALEAQAKSIRYRDPILARAAKLSPKRYAEMSAKAMQPHRDAAVKRRKEQAAHEVKRKKDETKRVDERAAKSALALSNAVDKRLAELGLVPAAGS